MSRPQSRLPIRLLQVAVVASCSLTAVPLAADTPSVGTITTLAGTGTAGYNGDLGAATAAQLYQPWSTAVDSSGNVYIADTYNHRVRKVAAGTGVITTIAGTGIAGFLGDGGAATAARVFYPSGLAINPAGDVFICDRGNHRIRKITAATGNITTVAGSGTAAFGGDGGVATAAQLYYPASIALDASGNLYIADEYNVRIRKVAAGTNIISTVAGNGTAGYNGDGLATSASLNYPQGVGVDLNGNVFIADTNSHRIRKVDPGTGIISTVVNGSGTAGFLGEAGVATAARLYSPAGLAVDASGNVYIADSNNDRIRKYVPGTGLIFTVAGSGIGTFGGDGGLATAGQIYHPQGVSVDGSGNLYIADSYNHRVRKVSPPTTTLVLSTVAGTGTPGYNGDGVATNIQLNYPQGTTVDAAGNVYIADTNNQRIRKVAAATGIISTYAGTGVAGFSGEAGPATSARIYGPTGMAADAAGNIYFADTNNHRIRKITAATGIITTVAGSGTPGYLGEGIAATAAQLWNPTGVAVDGNGNIYIADENNHRIRLVLAASGLIYTMAGTGTAGVAGDGGLATNAQLSSPQGVAVDAAANVYIADTNNHRIRKINSATGIITTIGGTGIAGFLGEAGPATAARLYYPAGIAADAAGNVYFADYSNHRVRRIAAASGIINTVVGSEAGYGGDGGAATAGQIYYPYGVALDSSGSIFVADYYNSRVRRAGVPLLPATNLQVWRTNQTTVVLCWTAPGGATSYNVKRGTVSGGETLLAGGITGTCVYSQGAIGARYFFVISAVYGAAESPNSNEVSIALTPTAIRSDADGDAKSDIIVYRGSTGNWYIRNSSFGYTVGVGNWNFQWGVNGDTPMGADYDGDGKLDPAVYRPSTGEWFIRYSSLNYVVGAGNWYLQWGLNGDTPIARDFDGDGKADIAVFRPTTGEWFIRYSSLGYAVGAGNWYLQWGLNGDLPYPSDFDGDGKADLALYRPTTGEWLIRNSTNGYAVGQGNWYFQWGLNGDTAVPADYDGDGWTDLGVYRPSTGQWFLRLSTSNYVVGAGNWVFQWGLPGDLPKLSDFDGDGKVDLTVYRPTTGEWLIRLSGQGYAIGAGNWYFQWGLNGDTALPTAN
jgi:hypothetical protein